MPRENKASDETGKARSAAEDAVLRDNLAKSTKKDRPGEYLPRVDALTDQVDAQMKRDRAG